MDEQREFDAEAEAEREAKADLFFQNFIIRGTWFVFGILAGLGMAALMLELARWGV